MNPNRMDELSKAVAAGTSRRLLLGRVMTGAAASVLAQVGVKAARAQSNQSPLLLTYMTDCRNRRDLPHPGMAAAIARSGAHPPAASARSPAVAGATGVPLWDTTLASGPRP